MNKSIYIIMIFTLFILSGLNAEEGFVYSDDLYVSDAAEKNFSTSDSIDTMNLDIDKLYKQGMDKYFNKDFYAAKKIFNKILIIQPGHEKASKMYDKIIHDIIEQDVNKSKVIQKTAEKIKSNELFYTGKHYFLIQDYQTALKYFTSAIKVNPKNEKAREYIIKCMDLLTKQKKEKQLQKQLRDKKKMEQTEFREKVLNAPPVIEKKYISHNANDIFYIILFSQYQNVDWKLLNENLDTDVILLGKREFDLAKSGFKDQANKEVYAFKIKNEGNYKLDFLYVPPDARKKKIEYIISIGADKKNSMKQDNELMQEPAPELQTTEQAVISEETMGGTGAEVLEENEESTVVIQKIDSFALINELVSRKMFDRAIKLLEKELESESPARIKKALLKLYNIYYQIENYDSALKYLQEYKALFPTDRKINLINYNIADVYYKKKQYNDAITKFLEIILQDNKYSSKSQYMIAKIYILKNDNRNALTEFKKLINNFPDSDSSIKSLYDIGNIYFYNQELKDFAKALKYYQSYLKKFKPGFDADTKKKAEDNIEIIKEEYL